MRHISHLLFAGALILVFALVIGVDLSFAQDAYQPWAQPGQASTSRSHFYTILLSPLGGFALLVLGGGGLAFLLVGGESRAKENYIFGGLMVVTAVIMFVLRVFVSTGVVDVMEVRSRDAMTSSDIPPVATGHEVSPFR